MAQAARGPPPTPPAHTHKHTSCATLQEGALAKWMKSEEAPAKNDGPVRVSALWGVPSSNWPLNEDPLPCTASLPTVHSPDA